MNYIFFSPERLFQNCVTATTLMPMKLRTELQPRITRNERRTATDRFSPSRPSQNDGVKENLEGGQNNAPVAQLSLVS